MESSVNNSDNFISSKDADEEQVMHSKSDNTEFMAYDNANDAVDELFDEPCDKCHKISFKRGGSDIDSLDQIKKKKSTINSKNKDDKCFQYAATVALNYGEIELHPERVSNIMPFIDKHNWDGIKCPSKIDD